MLHFITSYFHRCNDSEAKSTPATVLSAIIITANVKYESLHLNKKKKKKLTYFSMSKSSPKGDQIDISLNSRHWSIYSLLLFKFRRSNFIMNTHYIGGHLH